jgi:hypothetical protein
MVLCMNVRTAMHMAAGYLCFRVKTILYSELQYILNYWLLTSMTTKYPLPYLFIQMRWSIWIQFFNYILGSNFWELQELLFSFTFMNICPTIIYSSLSSNYTPQKLTKHYKSYMLKADTLRSKLNETFQQIFNTNMCYLIIYSAISKYSKYSPQMFNTNMCYLLIYSEISKYSKYSGTTQ